MMGFDIDDLKDEIMEEGRQEVYIEDVIHDGKAYFNHGREKRDDSCIETEEADYITLVYWMAQLPPHLQELLEQHIGGDLLDRVNLKHAQKQANRSRKDIAQKKCDIYQKMYELLLQKEPELSKRAAAVSIRNHLIEQGNLKRIPSTDSIRKKLSTPSG